MKRCQTCKEFKASVDFYPDYPRCKRCDKEAQAKYKLESPQKFRLTAHKKRLKHSYNLEYTDYLRMCEEQNNLCKICGKDNKGWKLAVDHCHDTGNIRGLLCNTCNRAIGLFNDNAALLRKAADYIERNTMNSYVTQFDYSIRTGGSRTFLADSKDEAEMLAKEYISEIYPDAFDIEVVEVDAIK